MLLIASRSAKATKPTAKHHCQQTNCRQQPDPTTKLLNFYRNEGVLIALPNWKKDAGAHIVGKKISEIKRSIHEKKVKEHKHVFA